MHDFAVELTDGICIKLRTFNYVTIILFLLQSQAMIEQAIQMALLRGNIYSKMQDVFLKYEEGTLKGQKPRIMEGVTLQKALEGKLAPKLQHFKIFQGLEV